MAMNILQKTLFPAPGFPENLYLRISNPKFLRQVVPVTPAQGAAYLELARKEVLSTDTFFGSFYAAYWRKLTAIRSLSLSVTFTGAGSIRVFEDTGRGVVLLSTLKAVSDGTTPVILPLSTGGLTPSLFDEAAQPSRIFAEFEASKASQVMALDFVTDQPTAAEVSLSIGLCTFNQEVYFARTLEKIAALAARNPAVQQVYVVNQGKPFQSEAITTLLEAPKLTLVAQRNLGGCGGFTRSILEAQEAAKPASHHLLMDDDIVLDERLIERSIRFLSFADQDIVLGGGMLDAMEPQRMYEAGAFLEADNTIVPYCHNVDMADPAQLHHFNTVVKTDYNAWWFCILPLEQTRDIGLPPPVFIRGDDFEYGQRLARKGVPTITLPGIGVWHEPFYAKPMGWQAYYDLRNRLIFGATYPEKVRPLSMLRMVNMLVTPVLTHQYMIAALRMKAVEDFLNGPDPLFAKDAETLHGEVSAIGKALAPEKLDQSTWKPKPGAEFLPEQLSTGAITRQYLKSILSLFFLPFKTRPKVFLDVAAHPRNTRNQAYVLTNGPRSFHILLKPMRGLAIRQIFAATALLFRYRRTLAKASDIWLKSIPEYRKTAYWKDVFK